MAACSLAAVLIASGPFVASCSSSLHGGGNARGTSVSGRALLSVPFVVGEVGFDGCSAGFVPIRGEALCAIASVRLGLCYDPTRNANIGLTGSVCNWCGGCGGQTTRVDNSHGSLAKFLCAEESVGNATYTVSDQLCANRKGVYSREWCQEAAAELGLSYKGDANLKKDGVLTPSGCFYWSRTPGSTGVYFSQVDSGAGLSASFVEPICLIEELLQPICLPAIR